MPFKEGETPEGAVPFKEGESGNPHGRPKGKKSRSTIARKVLEMVAKFPTGVFEKLKEQYPELESTMTMEEMMTIVHADKAIRKQDSQSYEKVLDSAYGKPKQDLDLTSAGQPLNRNITIEISKPNQKP